MIKNTQKTSLIQETVPWGSRGITGVSIPAALSFEDVALGYGGIAAVVGVSFEVQPGEIVCLLGRSGCGKTSLLRLAAGLLRPDSGTIRLNQMVVSGDDVHILPEHRHVGMMFQDYALFEHMSNIKNVQFGLHGLDQVAAKAQADQALARVGLCARANDYPGQLSGGEQQRLALARAIAPRPSILLMDEPFSGLDSQLRLAMRNQTHAVLRETGATSIVVTHDPQEAMILADRIILMNRGQVHQIGTPADLYTRPKDMFSAQFFSPVTSIIAKQIGFETQPPHVTTALGIRPEHVRLVAEENIKRDSVKKGQIFGGRITDIRFSGLYDIIEIATEISDEPLLAYDFKVGYHKKGAIVGIELMMDKLLVFAI